MEYSLGPENVTDPYHIGVIRTALNRNLAACYPNIHEEVVQSFKDVLALDGDGEPTIIRLRRALICFYRVEGCASYEHDASDHLHRQ